MEYAGGGQVLYPRIDEQWQPAAELERHVERALAALPGEVFPSIELGGYAVLAGTARGVKHLLGSLPKVTLGKTTYPFQLAQHGPYHTPLAAEVSRAAHKRLESIEFRSPEIPLVDGHGRRWSPWSTDLDALRAYTLGTQVTEPYDLTTAVRVLLREHAPQRLVLPGPGNTLGGVCGQILMRERWRGVTTREEFDRVQSGEEPLLESMRR